jgi:hypothetical protein
MYLISRSLFEETFRRLRECGQDQAECQVLWVSPWAAPESITAVVHPKHLANIAGFELDSFWVTSFWKELSKNQLGVRIQVHSHPGRAYHSRTDDNWPVIHTAGFLSLVVPDFARGRSCLDGTYLAELLNNGNWQEVPPCERIKVT